MAMVDDLQLSESLTLMERHALLEEIYTQLAQFPIPPPIELFELPDDFPLPHELGVYDPAPAPLARFTGVYPEKWLAYAESFFTYYKIHNSDRFPYVSYYFDDEAAIWFSSFQSTEWSEFVASLMHQFGYSRRSQNKCTLQSTTNIESALQVFDEMLHSTENEFDNAILEPADDEVFTIQTTSMVIANLIVNQSLEAKKVQMDSASIFVPKHVTSLKLILADDSNKNDMVEIHDADIVDSSVITHKQVWCLGIGSIISHIMVRGSVADIKYTHGTPVSFASVLTDFGLIFGADWFWDTFGFEPGSIILLANSPATIYLAPCFTQSNHDLIAKNGMFQFPNVGFQVQIQVYIGAIVAAVTTVTTLLYCRQLFGETPGRLVLGNSLFLVYKSNPCWVATVHLFHYMLEVEAKLDKVILLSDLFILGAYLIVCTSLVTIVAAPSVANVLPQVLRAICSNLREFRRPRLEKFSLGDHILGTSLLCTLSYEQASALLRWVDTGWVLTGHRILGLNAPMNNGTLSSIVLSVVIFNSFLKETQKFGIAVLLFSPACSSNISPLLNWFTYLSLSIDFGIWVLSSAHAFCYPWYISLLTWMFKLTVISAYGNNSSHSSLAMCYDLMTQSNGTCTLSCINGMIQEYINTIVLNYTNSLHYDDNGTKDDVLILLQWVLDLLQMGTKDSSVISIEFSFYLLPDSLKIKFEKVPASRSHCHISEMLYMAHLKSLLLLKGDLWDTCFDQIPSAATIHETRFGAFTKLTPISCRHQRVPFSKASNILFLIVLLFGYCKEGKWGQAMEPWHYAIEGILGFWTTRIEGFSQAMFSEMLKMGNTSTHQTIICALLVYTNMAGGVKKSMVLEGLCKMFGAMAMRDVTSWSTLLRGPMKSQSGDNCITTIMYMETPSARSGALKEFDDLIAIFDVLNLDFMDPHITLFAALYGRKPPNIVVPYIISQVVWILTVNFSINRFHLEDKVNLKGGSNVMSTNVNPSLPNQLAQPGPVQEAQSMNQKGYIGAYKQLRDQMRGDMNIVRMLFNSSSHLKT